MEKHYDLIVSLIRDHRKFNEQYEAIIDDIVNDVYKHSETLLDSITDEDVIKSYLNKIVSVSIITVPKNLGVVVKRHAPSGLPEMNESLTIIEQEPVNVVTEPKVDESNVYSNETEYVPENLDVQVDENGSEENGLEVTNEQIECVLEEPEKSDINEIQNNDPDVDISLVDKMINGVPKESDSIDIDEYTVEDEVVAEEISSDETDDFELLTSEDVDIDPVDVLYTNESLPFEELSAVENITETENVSIENEIVDDDLTIEDNISVQDDILENADNGEPDLSIDGTDELLPAEDISAGGLDIDLSDSLEVDSLEPVELLDDGISTVSEELEISAPLENLTEADTSSIVEKDSITDYEETNKCSVDEKVKGLDYTCFDYKPDDLNIDCSEIENELSDIDSKNPEKRILDVCKLKFSDKKSIKDIADTLSMPEESVLESLYEIIDVVKDSYV